MINFISGMVALYIIVGTMHAINVDEELRETTGEDLDPLTFLTVGLMWMPDFLFSDRKKR